MRTIEWKDGIVTIVDQRKLPNQEVWVELKNYKDMAYAIKEMQVRGAPLIGVSAAYGLALTAFHSTAKTREELLKELEEAAALLRTTRPTAVNLFWAIDRLKEKVK